MKQESLLEWYQKNARPLPWRQTKDPYKIWISEIMLQQTTVTAVKPYYDRFLIAFPNVKKLANSDVADVISNWSGLGYYSRARNLHKTAQVFNKSGFPHPSLKLLRHHEGGLSVPLRSRIIVF